MRDMYARCHVNKLEYAMYVEGNPRTKKQLRDWIAAGKRLTAFQPGPYADKAPKFGEVSVEGPHFPEPHRWYARVVLDNGIITEVKA